MLVSTKGRYALRVMIDLAENSKGAYIPLKDIAKRQQISEKYLESILPVLARGELLTGVRGKGGGYRLTRAPEDYTVGSILRLVEGNLAPVACLAKDEILCAQAAECQTLPMWQDLHSVINEYFDGITLAALCANKQEGNDFVI